MAWKILIATGVSMLVIVSSVGVQASETGGMNARVHKCGLARGCGFKASLRAPAVKFACVWRCTRFCSDNNYTYCCPGADSCD
jgi:hypothetical protein